MHYFVLDIAAQSIFAALHACDRYFDAADGDIPLAIASFADRLNARERYLSHVPPAMATSPLLTLAALDVVPPAPPAPLSTFFAVATPLPPPLPPPLTFGNSLE